MNLQNEVRTKIAVQAPLKLSRQNSGGDRTVFVCDGAKTFYSGDGHSYYLGEVTTTPQCDFPLSRFYELDNDPTSVSLVGRDHVRLGAEDRECALVRATWKQDTVNIVRTLCIDPGTALILRNSTNRDDEKTGMRMVTSTTLVDFESDPTFPPDTFRFSIPPGAVEAKPPN
jgi:outer membrane lipoprotein-sorting protein